MTLALKGAKFHQKCLILIRYASLISPFKYLSVSLLNCNIQYIKTVHLPNTQVIYNQYRVEAWLQCIVSAVISQRVCTPAGDP